MSEVTVYLLDGATRTYTNARAGVDDGALIIRGKYDQKIGEFAPGKWSSWLAVLSAPSPKAP